MGVVENTMDYETLKVQFDGDTCFVEIHRPDAKNTINDRLIEEFSAVLDQCEENVSVVVVQGSPEVFCFGADFKGLQQGIADKQSDGPQDPEPMYNVWLRLASGPYITIAHVRGRANAGGVGFVAACDVVICESRALFSLSELLFGLMPACVLPFLIRRMGFSKAHYMTLSTEPVSAEAACAWGLVDDYAENSQDLLRKKLLRFKRLSKTAIARYKRYMNTLDGSLLASMNKAIEANIEVFSDRESLEKIARYVTTGRFPWEDD